MTEAVRLSEALTKEELRDLSTPSDVKAIISLAFNWALIVAAFAVPIIWTNPLTIFAAIIFLGGRQLGLGILTMTVPTMPS